MKIAKYNIPKDNSNSSERTPGSVAQLYGTGANSQVTIAESAKQLADTHTIWGQPFNGTQDVAGDIINAQNITNEGDINIKSYNDVSGNHGGNLYADNSVNAKNFIGKTGDFSEKILSSNGIIDELLGKNLEYSYANLAEILSQNITTKNLTVTGTAHFFELIIDKIKAAGGAVILSPADGFKVEKVINNKVDRTYRLCWKANDGEKAISNMWQPGDQAICRNFNQATLGNSQDVTNKYYWAVVDAKGTTTIDGQDYHYIQIYANNHPASTSCNDGKVNPEPGDEIAMLGSRNNNHPERQAAIYISAYSSLDETLEAPFICQYTGINDFNLSSHKYTWLARNGNELRGNLKISSGDTVEQKLSELQITTDGLTSKVEAMNGWEYDLFLNDNWTTFPLLTNKSEGTIFEDCFTTPPAPGQPIQIANSMSFKHLLRFSETTFVTISGLYNVTILYFDVNRNYMAKYRTYSSGEHQIENIENAYYIGITISTIPQSSAQIVPKPIGNPINALKSSQFNIFDTKIASSLIQQTAKQIMLKVDEVSLRIDNQKIVLDGDTEVNGSLTLDNTETGFILKGNGGETNISPKSIGTYSSFTATSAITSIISRNISSTMYDPTIMEEGNDSSTANPVRNWTTEENLGYLKNGDYIQFTDQTLSFSANDGGAMSSGIKLYKLTKDNTVVKTWSTYSHNVSGELFSYTTTSAGNYKLQISINFNCTRTKPANTSTGIIQPWTGSVGFKANYSCKYSKPTSDAHMLIGYDGIAANFGNNKTVFIGKEESTFKYGNFGIRISSSGIQKYSNGNWVTANI